MAKILFVQEVLFDYHSIETLSAVLKKAGHTVDIFILAAEKEKVNSYIKRTNPDVVSFSVSSSDYKWCLPIAKIVKDLGKITLFGGPHPTYFPKFINEKHVDVICVGEGDETIVEFCNALDKGKDYSKIKNLWVKKGSKIIKNDFRKLVDDLDKLPDPDKTIYYKYKFLRDTPVKRIMTSRGCPYNCTYCYNQKYRALYTGKGKYVRYRSKENIVKEILEIKRKVTLKAVTFTSDTFTPHKKWVIDFLKYYKEKVGLPFYCQLRANDLDEDIVRTLKECGCRYIYFGLEAGNEFIRNKVYKKNITNEHILNAARLFNKYKLKFLTYNIFGAPGETLDMVWETINLNRKIKPDAISVTILQPQVGTELHKMILDNNLFISGCENAMFGHYSPSTIKLRNKSKIENLHKFAYFAILYPITIPFIKILINLPPNPLFNLVFKFSLFLKYRKSRNYSLLDMLKIGWNLRKFA